MNNVKIISGTSHPELAKQISEKLGVQLCKCITEKFSNTEIRIEILESIRNKDIFIVQTGSYNTDENNDLHLTDSFAFKELGKDEQFQENGRFSKQNFDAFARSNEIGRAHV